MNKNTYLANRLREVLLSGTWIANTNYKAQITNTNFTIATAKVHELNTIAALTFHINYYLEGLLNVFNGGTLDIKDEYSFDMPKIESENDWNNLVSRFLKNAESFAAHVEQLDEGMLDSDFISQKYGSYFRNIEAVIEHSYYHLGQLVLIKKLALLTTKLP